MTLFFSVSSENIPGIDFLFYIVQTAVVAVGNDGVGLLFEVLQIVYDYRSEEYTPMTHFFSFDGSNAPRL